MDSGATSFTLLRSGAQKLCDCSGVDHAKVQQDMEKIDALGCIGPIFGPMKVLDHTFDECQTGNINLADYSEGDSKLSEAGLLETDHKSFPTAVWDDVTDEDCDDMTASAQARMVDYRGICGITSVDMDSGATSFTLLRSGAQKLCDCSGVDHAKVQQDMEKIDALGCIGPIFGPMKVLDHTFDECKTGNINLADYSEGDSKLSEAGLLETDHKSFPTQVWEEVLVEQTCNDMVVNAQARMAKYRGTCGIGQGDIDSGATSFTLLRSGAQKLCECSDVDQATVKKDMDKTDALRCTGPIFGPVKVMDRTFDNCFNGDIDLADYSEGDSKLSESGI